MSCGLAGRLWFWFWNCRFIWCRFIWCRLIWYRFWFARYWFSWYRFRFRHFWFTRFARFSFARFRLCGIPLFSEVTQDIWVATVGDELITLTHNLARKIR